MATTVPLTMSAVIDEVLDYAHQYSERPGQVVVGANDLSSAGDTTFTLALGTLNPTDVVEFGQELLLVTDVSTAADPVYTVSRGYLSTTPLAVPAGTVGGANPLYPRYQVQRAITRCFAKMNGYLPHVTSATVTRAADKDYVLLSADTVRVLEVGRFRANGSRYERIGGWDFVEDADPSEAAGTKFLRLPTAIGNDQELLVKRQTAYAWSPTPATEASTISVPLGGEDLPVLFAVARLVAGREISRSELDKVEEWNHEAALRGGVNLRLMQALWSDYYHAVQEVRSVQNVPKHRPYRKMLRLPSSRRSYVV